MGRPKMKKISIIITVYNCNKYTDELLDCLDKQVNDDVQVIVVDDGSKTPYSTKYEWVQLIHKINGGASSARNVGLENVKGKYVAFIDGDDLIPDYYVEKIIEKIDQGQFDYCYMSWKTIGNGWRHEKKLTSVEDEFDPWNLCVWNRIWRFAPIKDIKFNEKKLIAEDAEYIHTCADLLKVKEFIPDCMYYYRADTPDSLTKKFANGELNTQRVVYYLPTVSANMENLIDEVKSVNEYAEVIIMTDRNEINELEKYAMVMKPCQIKGTELRGNNTVLFTKINIPIKTQVVIYTEKTFNIGGIETFIYNFCMNMKDKYDIAVVYDYMDVNQIKRLKPYVMVEKNDPKRKIECDTVIVNRITDTVPLNIKYDKKIQMVHSCQLQDDWHVPSNNDCIVPVSNVVYNSYKSEIDGNNNKIIHNFTYNSDTNRVLRLTSATRLTFEKGEQRMINLAKMLNNYKIPFVWQMFSERKLREDIPGIVYMNPTTNVRDYFVGQDYVVCLSDSEAFGFTAVEALELGIPLIATDIPILDELGFVDGVHGFKVDFDLSNIDIHKIYNSKLNFNYVRDNEKIKKQWISLLGNTTPTGSYKYEEPKVVNVECIRDYNSLRLGRIIHIGEVLETDVYRANELSVNGFVKILY